jgi:uncharacterized damage-inducible protein DinB
MTEIARIQDQLQRAFDGDAWHGPPLMTILKDMPASKAAAKPIPGSHTVWELVGHLIAWERICVRRLAGEQVLDVDIPEEVNFPPVTEVSEAAWKRTRNEVGQAHQELSAAIGHLTDAQLDDRVAGKNYSVYVMLHGLVQHRAYHTGQIALLKMM